MLLARQISDFLYPDLCLRCRCPVDAKYSFCAPCWAQLSFITPPYCQICSDPFPYAVGAKVSCAMCTKTRPFYAKVWAPLVYDEASRPLIFSFKHGGHIEMGPAFAQLMIKGATDLLSRVDYLIPVPMHFRRLLTRQYNQATVLAKAITKKTGIPTLTHQLRRRRAVHSQGKLSRADRIKNVKNTFLIAPRAGKILQNKRVMVVDDVMTTGATLNECARVLLSHGVQEVYGIVCARAAYPK